MKWLAPAKINLSLRVLGRRPDGFHEIETLMAPLNLADELDVAIVAGETPGGIELSCDEPSLPTGAGNLAFRAAVLFRDRVHPTLAGVRIHLKKRIPHGAGLGGGSSDAATVLLALNELCATGLTSAALAALAAELGSDVPFFVYRSVALCRGRGEKVEPVEFGETIPLLLIKPSFPIPTPWAYQRWRDAREVPGVRYAPQVFPWGELVNDLERPVYEKYIVLGEIKRWLLAQPEVIGALMSGSGSTMIALLSTADDHQRLADRVHGQFGALWTCPSSASASQGLGTSAPLVTPESAI